MDNYIRLFLYIHRDYICVNHGVSLPGHLADLKLLVWVLGNYFPVKFIRAKAKQAYRKKRKTSLL